MDERLFGVSTRQDRLLEQSVTWIVGIFVFLTVFFGVVNGFWKSFAHLFLVFTIMGSTVSLLQLLRWWRNGDLEPKFRFYIIKQAVWLISLCCIANVYFWSEVNCRVIGSIIAPGQDD